MEKIKEIFKKLLEKVNSMINGIKDVKMLEKENYYIYKILKPNMVNEVEIGKNIEYVGEISEGTFCIGGLELPIGSFEIKGNDIDVNEQVTITPDGQMYMRGKPICNNEKIQEEIARQIKQNGRPTQVKVDENGDIIKTDAEEYRSEMYDDDARKRTEQVSKNWEEKQEAISKQREQIQENEK